MLQESTSPSSLKIKKQGEINIEKESLSTIFRSVSEFCHLVHMVNLTFARSTFRQQFGFVTS